MAYQYIARLSRNGAYAGEIVLLESGDFDLIVNVKNGAGIFYPGLVVSAAEFQRLVEQLGADVVEYIIRAR